MRRGLRAALPALFPLPLLAFGPSGSEPAAKPAAGRGMQADGQACSDKVRAAAEAQRATHPLVGVQRWIQCMEEFGWSQKKKS